MDRTINVQGTGSVSVSPDTVVLNLSVTGRDPAYEAAVEKNQTRVAALTDAAVQAGFDKEDLKTTRFNVSTEYEGVQEPGGVYKNVLVGHICQQDLRLRFPFTAEALAKTLSALGGSGAEPELHISFTVKEPEAVREQLLRSAAENARAKAEILCAASGVRLGALLRIDYHWSEEELRSETALFRTGNGLMAKAAAFDNFTPEMIEKTDSAGFVWAISDP